MFKIIASPTFTCAVQLSVPGTDKSVPVQFTFRHKTARQLHAWIAASRAADDLDPFVNEIFEIVEDWQGVAGPDDQAVPFTKAALTQLLDQFPAAGAEIVRAYHRQLADARAKN